MWMARARGFARLGLLSLGLALAGCSASPQSPAEPFEPAIVVQIGQRTPEANFKPASQASIIEPAARFELLWANGQFTEGPAAAKDGSIYFTDIGDRIMRFDPKTGHVATYRQPSGKANGLIFDASGRLVACEGADGGHRRISITDARGNITPLASNFEGDAFNSPNDLTIAPGGRIYFTDPRYGGTEPRELAYEGIFSIDPDGKVRLASGDLQKPNGILASADGRWLYVADNNPAAGGNLHLVRFAIASDGSLKDKRILHTIAAGNRGIDGMTLDDRGNLYATAGVGQASGIYVFGPDGSHLAFIPGPDEPTNCVFGRGPDGRTLYVTARAPKNPAAPDQQAKFGLYRIRLLGTGYHLPR